jgi:hypothetical protein
MPLATFTVTSVDDFGAGTLREAIELANANAGRDEIHFDIAEADVRPIRPSRGLPKIVEPVVIDGTTQPSFESKPIIELDGSRMRGGFRDGLKLLGGDSVIRGLSIYGFNRDGIQIKGGAGNVIEGNYIGVKRNGNKSLGNGRMGIEIINSSDNVIGGTTAAQRNVIGGNGTGIYITGQTGATRNNVIQGNYVGTNARGNSKLGNGVGITLKYAEQSVIGGAGPGEGNLISGNRAGISITRADDVKIVGNLVGTNVTGTKKLANESTGINIIYSDKIVVGGTEVAARNVISGSRLRGLRVQSLTNSVVFGNLIGTDATGTVSIPNRYGIEMWGTSMTIGGANPGEGNIISGNERIGVFLAAGRGHKIVGNYIGTDITGTKAVGNGSAGGIQIGSAKSNIIGGAGPGEGNVISGNGLGLASVHSQRNIIIGNKIGTDVTGTMPLGNEKEGVFISVSAKNIVGGEAPNIIAFNGRHGVGVFGPNAIDNTITGNSIFSNGGLGIKLDSQSDIATPNDDGDKDKGANGLQNYPVVASAVDVNGVTRITGTLSSKKNTTYVVDFYSSAVADPSGFGEGETFIGSTVVTTDRHRNAAFDVDFAVEVPLGHVITATATDPRGNTSEFSAAREVVAPPNANIDGPAAGVPGQALPFTVSAPGADGEETVTYTFDWADGSPAEKFTGPRSGIEITHAFERTGGFLISVSATDENGVTGSLANHHVAIDSVVFNSGKVVVAGTDGSDRIFFKHRGSDVEVFVNGQSVGRFANPQKLVAFGFGGNDRIKVRGSNATTTAEFFGGPGNDVLLGTKGDDVLNGEEGNDLLFGNGGNDLINGGEGSDQLFRRGSRN